MVGLKFFVILASLASGKFTCYRGSQIVCEEEASIIEPSVQLTQDETPEGTVEGTLEDEAEYVYNME